VIATYASALVVCAASLAIGQGALALCGVRRWSWLAPPVGLALVCAICWGTVRLPGDGAVSAVLVAALALDAVILLRSRVEAGRGALRLGLPVGAAALAAASLPFIVEGHFGILGTSFNPDMSQHLLAADRLAHGDPSQLLRQGYPLGPHAVVVALNKGLGIGLVQGFSGLTVAVAVLAPLTALAAFQSPFASRAEPGTGGASGSPASTALTVAGSLVVGLPYVVASYFAQGAFKETMQALFLLGFVLTLREATRVPAWRDAPLRLVPAGLIAVGTVYVYSFPGLLWLGGALLIWLLLERALPARALLLALLAFALLAAPEIGRMVDFRNFETFNPSGPGLGNLFGQISPFEALGIWPSGDFRLAPGDGAVPAVGYWLGAAFALVLFAWGTWRCARRRETSILAGLAATALAYVAARVGGTPYTAAKAIELASPLVAMAIVLPAIGAPRRSLRRSADKSGSRRGPGGARASVYLGAAGALYLLVAGVCSLLAFANAPVGPTAFSPALSELRKEVGAGPTLVLAPPKLLSEEHGTPFLAWELRGGRVCIAAEGEVQKPPPGVRFVINRGAFASGGGGAIVGGPLSLFRRFQVRKARPPWVLWEAKGPVAGHSPCPLIAERQARRGPAGGH
jgi:hypothetical protein